MYQRHELFGDLPSDDVSASLNACDLAEKDEYTEDELYRFRECRQMVEQKGKTYKEVAELFQRNGVIPNTQPQANKEDQIIEPGFQSKVKKPKNDKKPVAKLLDFFELISVSSKLLGSRVLPKEAIKIMEACGLSADAEQYNQEECDRFLEACNLHKNQGKTHTETDLLQQVDDATDLIQEEVSAATDEIVQQKAEEHALNDYRRYVGHYAQALRSGRKVQEFLNDLRSYSKDRLEGKPQQVRLKSATPVLSLPSDTTSTNSSENSSNGMTNE